MKQATIVGIATLLGGIAGGLTYLFTRNPRDKVVKAALGEVGKARTQVYWLDTFGEYSDKEWCGVFALWCLHQAGLAKNWKWEIEKGFLYHLPTTLNPKPGDIAYILKNQHEAVITEVNGEMISLINGNGWNHVVSVSETPRSEIAAFYSIEGLIKGTIK
jgi:uncharacterized protein with GYD domain